VWWQFYIGAGAQSHRFRQQQRAATHVQRLPVFRLYLQATTHHSLVEVVERSSGTLGQHYTTGKWMLLVSNRTAGNGSTEQ